MRLWHIEITVFRKNKPFLEYYNILVFYITLHLTQLLRFRIA